MKGQVDSKFLDLLEDFSLDVLDSYPTVVMGLWADSRIGYLNPAWDAFASANGGQPAIRDHWGLGARMLDAVSACLQPFYQALFVQSKHRSRTDQALHPVSHEYECSSSTVFRRFQMNVYSLREGQAFLTVHSLLVEEPHRRVPYSPEPADYLTRDGLIRQCAHCRRVANIRVVNLWDWVPVWAEHCPSNTTHTLCPVCMRYYYPPHGC